MNTTISYEETLAYLDKLEMFGIKLGLENISALCAALGEPHLAYKTIHVAGTNGKGSVTALCASALREAGYLTGMYTSPHLQTFRERIQVNGCLISKQEMVDCFLEVKESSDKLAKAGMQVTYFEFTTALAFLYFKKKQCEFAVIETGMGGRLDATNVIKPLVAVITNIELEHTQYLGDTKEKIAQEKAGIIKPGSIVIIGEREERIRKLLEETSRQKGSLRHTIVNEDYEGKISLLGDYQKRNAQLAKEAILSLGEFGIHVPLEAIERGIATATWPGRLEVVQKQPTVILDAAHNPAGVLTVAHYLRSTPCLGKIILVLGISADKDSSAMIHTLVPLAQKVIITEARYRAADSQMLAEEAKKYSRAVETVTSGVVDAVKRALLQARKDDLIMVTGSIFAIGEARSIWHPTDR